jgi:glycosyltransferase involved in cell wall biosynthesis
MTNFIERSRKSKFSDLELLLTSALFDAELYMAENPDVAAAADPYEHFLTQGGMEGRRPGAHFDSAAYLAAYEDVRLSGMNPLIHYLRFGQFEKRVPFPKPANSNESDLPDADLAPDQRAALYKELEDSGMFSAEFYCRQYPDIDPELIDPLDHYIDHGWRERRRPHPDFDEGLYLADYPDVAESSMMPLLHFIRIGRLEGRRASLSSNQWKAVERMLSHVAEIEPSILLDEKLDEPRQLALAHINRGGRLLRAWKELYASLEHTYDYVVMVPWLVRGGADLAACNAIRMAIKHKGVDSTLVVLTDHGKCEARDWLPEDCHIRIFSEIDPLLTVAERTRLVEMLIMSLRPQAVLNVNSHALWELTATRGIVVKKATDLYACLFCKDFRPDGKAAGYSDMHYKDSSIHLKRTYFDNQIFLDEVVADFGLPPSIQQRMVTVRQPILERAFGTYAGDPENRKSILWAGRFSVQKNVDLLIRIASLATEFDFHVYGYGEPEFKRKVEDAAATLPNFFLKGPFASTSHLPLNEHSIFLYTSLYDGLPLVFAEVAASGIPIVASNVGGIPDVLSAETGWPIHDFKAAEPYVDALREIRNDYAAARARGAAMSARIRSAHSAERYEADLLQSPSFLD